MLLLAVLVARSCTGTGDEISKDEAVEIAQQEIDYESERTVVRLIRRGVPKSRPYWAVSLSTVDADGRLERTTVVVVDANTKEIAEVRESNP